MMSNDRRNDFCKPMTNHKKFCVIKFLYKIPSGISDGFACVPQSWIITEQPKNKNVVVAYPNENPELTRKRIENGELLRKNWDTFMATVKDEADDFIDCNLWRIARYNKLFGYESNRNKIGDQSTHNSKEKLENDVTPIKLNLLKKTKTPLLTDSSRNTSATLQTTEPTNEAHSSRKGHDSSKKVQILSNKTISAGLPMHDKNNSNVAVPKKVIEQCTDEKANNKTPLRNKRAKSTFQTSTNSLKEPCESSKNSHQANIITVIPNHVLGIKKEHPSVVKNNNCKRNKRSLSLPSIVVTKTYRNNQNPSSNDILQHDFQINSDNNTISYRNEFSNPIRMSSNNMPSTMENACASESNQILAQLIKNNVLTEVRFQPDSGAPIGNFIQSRNSLDFNHKIPQNASHLHHTVQYSAGIENQFHRAANVDQVPRPQKIHTRRSTTAAVCNNQRPAFTGIQEGSPYLTLQSANQSFQVSGTLRDQQPLPSVLADPKTGKYFYIARTESDRGNTNVIHSYYKPSGEQTFPTSSRTQNTQIIQETPVAIYSETAAVSNQPCSVKQESPTPVLTGYSHQMPRKRLSYRSNANDGRQFETVIEEPSVVYVDSSDEEMDDERSNTATNLGQNIQAKCTTENVLAAENLLLSNTKVEDILSKNANNLFEKINSTLTETLEMFNVMRRSVKECANTLKKEIENINELCKSKINEIKVASALNDTEPQCKQIKKEVIELDTSDSDDDTVDYEVPRKKIKRKCSLVLPPSYNPRDPSWSLKYTKLARGLVEIIPKKRVYIEKIKFQHYKENTKDSTTLARNLMEEVFSKEALQVCSLKGKKSNNVSFEYVRPGLNENALNVILDFVQMHSKVHNWNDFNLSAVSKSMGRKLQSFRAKKYYY